MKIKVLSDTHGFHEMEPLDGVDLLIHCGDASNDGDPYRNESEFLNFWLWWEKYPAEYKIFVPGNHDTFLEHSISRTLRKSLKKSYWILIDDTIEIEGIKIFGSPYTPRFGSWAFMVNRSKIRKHWELIEEDTDIVITHGPPKSILDLSLNRNNELEFCGDSSLLKRIQAIEPKYHFFGHIHSNPKFENNGILIRNTTYMNCAQVVNGEFNGLKYFGKIIDL